MVWSRKALSFDVFDFSGRGSNVLRNSSAAPFVAHTGAGRLAGVHNDSTLLHLRLPVAAGEVDTVLELLADRRGSYRLWNSEGWSYHARRDPGDAQRSPLAGPVGRGILPAGTGPTPRPGTDPFPEGGHGSSGGSDRSAERWVAWTPAPTLPYIVELDLREGTYRTIGVTAVDLDSLQPGTTRQPPLHFDILTDGSLDGDPVACEGGETRDKCAALGGPCGWCEQRDGLQASMCVAGGPARPCAAMTCGAWRYFDPRWPDLAQSPPPNPPPAPPGLSAEALSRLEDASRRLPRPLRPEVEALTSTPGVAGADLAGHSSVEATSASALRQRVRHSLQALEQLALRPCDAEPFPTQPRVVWEDE